MHVLQMLQKKTWIRRKANKAWGDISCAFPNSRIKKALLRDCHQGAGKERPFATVTTRQRMTPDQQATWWFNFQYSRGLDAPTRERPPQTYILKLLCNCPHDDRESQARTAPGISTILPASMLTRTISTPVTRPSSLPMKRLVITPNSRGSRPYTCLASAWP